MSNQTVTFRYSISEIVRLKDISVIGRITGLRMDVAGVMFCVAYWNDGTRSEQWVYEWELAD